MLPLLPPVFFRSHAAAGYAQLFALLLLLHAAIIDAD